MSNPPSGTVPQAAVGDDAANAAAVKSRIHRYFSDTTKDYLKYYGTRKHHHMHYGFERDLPKGASPTGNMTRYLAKLAGLPSAYSNGSEGLRSARVLDAGCGMGGSSILLARESGAWCVGINLVEGHARIATAFAFADAAKWGTSAETPHAVRPAPSDLARTPARFVANDYTTPAFKPESFDVIWALESFCYAPDKEAWIRGMALLLKPGGRLVMADGFSGRAPATAAEARAFDMFLKGWAVPHFCSFDDMKIWATRAGLEVAHVEDITPDVLPHAFNIFRLGPIIVPWRWLLRKLNLVGEEKLQNAWAIYHQYPTLKKGIWRYGAFCFRKPDALDQA
jgi:tocopherol O-methyltransferase